MGPLFILGFPRSGTTAMASAVSSTGVFGTYSTEGHFLYLFEQGLDRIITDRVNPVSIMTKGGKKTQFLKDFVSIVNRTFSASGDPDDVKWIDKTPGQAQVQAMPTLLKLYPEARVIFMFRPVDEAVRSNLATWPDRLVGKERSIAERWMECQRAWRKTRHQLPKGQFLQLFQPNMLKKPRATAQTISEFLGLSQDETDTLAQFWTRNKKVNRPSAGAQGDKYDATTLTPKMKKIVHTIANDEIHLWPRLRKLAEAEGYLKPRVDAKEQPKAATS